MENNATVCAVIVTHNRKELLKRNVESLLRQTYPLDILIYDNASTDGTYEYLEKSQLIDKLIYVRSEENTGGAGGFCEGEKEAIRRGYDYLWLMDDDGYCYNEKTLETLINNIPVDNKLILNSYILADFEKRILSFDLGPYKTNEEVTSNSKDGILYGFGNPYNGTLVPKQCFEEVGYTDKRFFIYGDERDFFDRTNNAGYKWITVLDSLYYHPINRIVTKTLRFGSHTFEVKKQPVWKFFYEIRNNTYLIKRRHGSKRKMITWFFIICLMALNSEDHKLLRLKKGINAFSDGDREFFGRSVGMDK